MVKSLMITARRAGHRRAGIAHPGEPVYHDPADFSEEQLEALYRDPQLIVVDTEDEDAPEPHQIHDGSGQVLPPAGDDNEQVERIRQVEDLPSLVQLRDESDSEQLAAAINDRAAEIAGATTLPTRKADLQKWLTNHGVTYGEDDTIAKLSEAAQAYLAQFTAGRE